MSSFARIFAVAALVLAAASAPVAAAEALSGRDLPAARAAFAAADSGQWNRAYADAAPIHDALVGKLLRWLDYTRSSATGRFAEITRFLDENPDWPGRKALRKRAEEAAAGEPDAAVAAWFERHPPITTPGKVRAAEIMLDAGERARGTAALRAAWIDGDFGAADEAAFLARHGALIRPADNVKRLDQLLWHDKKAAARRMLARMPADYRALAEARLALEARSAKAMALVARVPARLRDDPGLRYEEVRWWRKEDKLDRAAQLLLARSGDPAHPAEWWHERRILARQLLADGRPDIAYRIVAGHGAIDGNAYADAEFLLGYVALRFKKNPALAFDHFSRILTRTDSPYQKARAGYWGGRAAEAEGKSQLAGKWFAAGAAHIATFYGQLAAHRLGDDAPPRPQPEPAADAAERARFDAGELVRATRILFAVGEDRLAKKFLLHRADRARTAVEFGMLAALAQHNGRPDYAIAVAGRAVRAGLPLMQNGYPMIALPPGGSTEHALLYAMMRQESAFAVAAVSWAGARGLMQLMPATARYVAKKIEEPFSAARLTADAAYNIVLGRAYLQTLLGDFNGSYALAIAAYNAGPGRVRQWLRTFGDPRAGRIDMVDWIEMIPVRETRSYVERVLENLQIYRSRTGRTPAFSLVSDLAR